MIARRPPSIVTMAMTQAKTGRAMKRADIEARSVLPRRGEGRRSFTFGELRGAEKHSLLALLDLAGCLVDHDFDRGRILADANELVAFDDDPVAVIHTAVDDPVVADAASDGEDALLDLAFLID